MPPSGGPQVVRIEYRRALVGSGGAGDPEKSSQRSWDGDSVPAPVLEAIGREGLLELGGVSGDPTLGEPMEYDHLALFTDVGPVEIEFYNRGLTLFTTDDEVHRRIHRVLSMLQRIP